MRKKHFIIFFITSIIFLTCSFEPLVSAKAALEKVTITNNILNIRKGPGLEFDIVQKAYRGESFRLIKEEGDWIQIDLGDGKNGWVANWLVSKNSSKIATDSSSTTITVDGLRLRNGPSINFQVLGTLKKGQAVEILTIKGSWAKVKSSLGIGWISKEFIQIPHKFEKQKEPQSMKKGTSTVNSLNVRSLPSTQGKIIGKLEKNEEVSILSELEDWFEIQYSGQSAWVSASYIKISSTNKADQGNLNKSRIPSLDLGPNLSNEGLVMRKIIIDPGHGGKDNGTTGTKGTKEKEMTLKTAQLLYEKLRAAGANVIMTRDEDTFISLESRASMAKYHNSDAFISIHYDSILDRSVTGMTSYYYHAFQKPLALKIHQAIASRTTLSDRGVRFGDYHVLRENEKAAVLLELGYLSNPSEELRITSAQFQKSVATGIYEGLEDYFSEEN